MSTPRRDSPERSRSTTMSINIPGRNRSQSPIHIRKNESPSEDVTVRARQSPTLGRSYNTQDELDSRERQRTLDVDMALQLSRARQNSVSLVSPAVVSPFHNPLTSSHGQLEHPPMAEHLPAFSEGEEREFEAARASGLGSAPPTMDGMHDAEPSEFGFPTDNSAVLNDSNEEARDADLLYTSAAAAETQDHRPKVPLAGREPFLPPMYQAAYGSNFDFGQMEDYARDEKRRLGLDTPMSPPAVLRWLDTTTAPLRQNGHAAGPSSSRQALNGDDGETNSVIGTDIGDGPVAGPSRIRQRKISQSAAVPRAGRGPGKKTALFEGVAGAPPPSLVPGAAIPASSAMSSHDNIFGGRSGYNPTATGGNNGGHDRPYRFSFYSNALSATIHARSLAELPADGQTFEQLFQGLHPDADFEQPSVPLSAHPTLASAAGTPLQTGAINLASRRVSVARGGLAPGYGMSETTPVPGASASKAALPLQSGASADGNTWWLDVLSPTDEEMKMLSKVFGIHPLTTEDILMEETREKIELFRNYYLVCFRGFDQDPYSPTYLEPLNMYIIVFREGTLSFHFRSTPHPQNVRRRIKQLKDYISVTSDWISYALIDDITDAFGPLIQGIEYEVDSIDELVLILKEAEQSDMLRRIGTCRKKVMGLLRLVGNKADVVKGLAKRCNENWRVAPTSDIGLYLSDIQDHLITMTQNLNHYEKILSRSHSNYLAQISIEMTEANNQINDVLSKMTALGTVLIPMNLITGLWGMNVNVPGQEADGLAWFGSILGGLIVFAAAGGWITFRLMSAR